MALEETEVHRGIRAEEEEEGSREGRGRKRGHRALERDRWL
jgi:hypothetical protein